MKGDGNQGSERPGRRRWLRNPVVVFAVAEALILIPVVVYLILR